MALALGTASIVFLGLLVYVIAPALRREIPRLTEALRARRLAAAGPPVTYDPGRELRAEQRARLLLRSCVSEEEWEMYRDLGFLRVWGGSSRVDRGEPSRVSPLLDRHPYLNGSPVVNGSPIARSSSGSSSSSPSTPPPGSSAPPYAYLIYPHKPILAYLPQTSVILNEYCVTFPDHTRPYGSALLPDSDDVLAKWMALTADERSLIADSNMHLPGRQIDPEQVRRDLQRLSAWERIRLSHDLHHDPRGVLHSEPDSPPQR